MSSTELARIDFKEYKPVYNVEEDIYEDKCPYLPYQRNRIRYNCSCASNAYFETNAKFNSHIKSKTHKRWLSYIYPKNVEKDKEIKRLNKQLRIVKQQLEVKNRLLKKAYDQKSKQRKIINELRKANKNKEKKC